MDANGNRPPSRPNGGPGNRVHAVQELEDHVSLYPSVAIMAVEKMAADHLRTPPSSSHSISDSSHSSRTMPGKMPPYENSTSTKATLKKLKGLSLGIGIIGSTSPKLSNTSFAGSTRNLLRSLPSLPPPPPSQLASLPELPPISRIEGLKTSIMNITPKPTTTSRRSELLLKDAYQKWKASLSIYLHHLPLTSQKNLWIIKNIKEQLNTSP